MRPTDANREKMTAWLTPGVTMNDLEIACMKAALEYRTTLGWPRVLKDAELQSISTPTLAIFGGESVISAPVISAQRIADHLPHGESVIIPGMGHGILEQAADQVVPRILEFLEQRDRSDAAANA